MSDDTKPAVKAAKPAAPEYHFTVVHPFGDYKRGDLIDDPDDIAQIHAGDNRHHCHKVTPK